MPNCHSPNKTLYHLPHSKEGFAFCRTCGQRYPVWFIEGHVKRNLDGSDQWVSSQYPPGFHPEDIFIDIPEEDLKK